MTKQKITFKESDLKDPKYLASWIAMQIQFMIDSVVHPTQRGQFILEFCACLRPEIVKELLNEDRMMKLIHPGLSDLIKKHCESDCNNP